MPAELMTVVHAFAHAFFPATGTSAPSAFAFAFHPLLHAAAALALASLHIGLEGIHQGYHLVQVVQVLDFVEELVQPRSFLILLTSRKLATVVD